MNLKTRIALRWLNIKVSENGTRWVVPHTQRERIERMLRDACERAWLKGKDARIEYTPDGGMTLHGEEESIHVRYVLK